MTKSSPSRQQKRKLERDLKKQNKIGTAVPTPGNKPTQNMPLKMI